MSGKVGAFDRIDRPTFSPKTILYPPFSLIQTSDGTPPKLAIKFEVGKIGNIIPTFNNASLTTDPKLILTSAGSKRAWLKVNITAVYDNYHPKVASAEIMIETLAAFPDRQDFKMEWVDQENRTEGAFYILIADFVVASAGDVFTITNVDQWLNQSYRSIVIVGYVDFDFVLPMG